MGTLTIIMVISLFITIVGTLLLYDLYKFIKKMDKYMYLLIILVILPSCSASKTIPTDFNFRKETINNKVKKPLKIYYCNGLPK